VRRPWIEHRPRDRCAPPGRGDGLPSPLPPSFSLLGEVLLHEGRQVLPPCVLFVLELTEDRRKPAGHFGGRRRSIVPLLAHEVAQQLVEGRGHIVPDDADVRGRIVEDLPRDLPHVCAVVQTLAGQHLEEQYAQGEKVGAAIEALEPQLFGRHVAELCP
jgi:hypothetical protein